MLSTAAKSVCSTVKRTDGEIRSGHSYAAPMRVETRADPAAQQVRSASREYKLGRCIRIGEAGSANCCRYIVAFVCARAGRHPLLPDPRTTWMSANDHDRPKSACRETTKLRHLGERGPTLAIGGFKVAIICLATTSPRKTQHLSSLLEGALAPPPLRRTRCPDGATRPDIG